MAQGWTRQVSVAQETFKADKAEFKELLDAIGEALKAQGGNFDGLVKRAEGDLPRRRGERS